MLLEQTILDNAKLDFSFFKLSRPNEAVRDSHSYTAVKLDAKTRFNSIKMSVTATESRLLVGNKGPGGSLRQMRSLINRIGDLQKLRDNCQRFEHMYVFIIDCDVFIKEAQ